MCGFFTSLISVSLLKDEMLTAPGVLTSGGLEGSSEQGLPEPQWSSLDLLRDVDKEWPGTGETDKAFHW